MFIYKYIYIHIRTLLYYHYWLILHISPPLQLIPGACELLEDSPIFQVHGWCAHPHRTRRNCFQGRKCYPWLHVTKSDWLVWIKKNATSIKATHVEWKKAKILRNIFSIASQKNKIGLKKNSCCPQTLFMIYSIITYENCKFTLCKQRVHRFHGSGHSIARDVLAHSWPHQIGWTNLKPSKGIYPPWK